MFAGSGLSYHGAVVEPVVSGALGLDELLRVSAFFGLSRSEESLFLESARPDLAFVLSGRDLPRSAQRWRSAHTAGARIRQATGPRDALRTAVEILAASFGPELWAFAVEIGPERRPQLAFVVGRGADAAGLPDAFFAGDRCVAYAPMYHDGAPCGGLGLASNHRTSVRPESLAFLRVVASLLEIQLETRS